MVMNKRVVRQILLVLYFLLNYDGIQGKIKLSKSEDLELEEQLKLLNKPSVKTIKSKSGDIYNCVDFYKQPAFDHPSLKNHNFYPGMKPTLTRSKQNLSVSSTNSSSRIWSKDGGCPFGTVPIRRITKEDLIRQRNLPPPENIITDTELTTTINNNSRWKAYMLAIVQTKKKSDNKFAGAGMVTSIYNPEVKGRQHSACRVKIQKGSDVLQAGWRVDPTLYGDNKTRLFVHFQAGNKQCFNTLCSGFVQVDTEQPIDRVLDKVTHRGQVGAWASTMFIERDLANGNWWFLFEKTFKQIGFWPQKIFTSLSSFADNVEWGGVVYSPPGVPKPPMGSSFLPIADSNYDAYCRALAVLDDKGTTISVEETTTYEDDPRLYQAWDYPHFIPGKFPHCVFYGGPGESH